MKKIPDITVAQKMINLQQSATSRNLEFDLTFNTVKFLMEQTQCFYTGVKFEPDGKLAFSVDRVDPKRGYVEGNVVACTIDINSKKANLSIDEIQSLNRTITEFLSKIEKRKTNAKTEKSRGVSSPNSEERSGGLSEG